MKKLLLVANVSKEHVRKFHIPFIQQMKALGWQVDVACRLDEPVPECDHCFDLPCDRNPFKGGLLKSVRTLKHILKENNYDVIHCNTITGSIVGRLAAKSFRKDGLYVIYTNHGLHFYKGAPISRWLLGFPMEKALAPCTDTLITINQADYETALKYLPVSKKIEKINGIGVNLSRFRDAVHTVDRKSVRDSLGISMSDFVLTYVAEINDNKNQVSLLESFFMVLQAIPDAKLLLVGPDHTDGKFRELISSRGLHEHVILTGWRNDIPQLLCSSDAYVASSKSEGLGLNLIEAMACNLPVVAYENRGHCEIIQHSVNGFLVKQDDHEEMARYIIELYEHPELRRRIVQQAQQDICKYEESNVLNQLCSIYNKLDINSRT